MLIRWWLLCRWSSKEAWKRKREEIVNCKRIARFYKDVVSCNFWKQIKHREAVCCFRCIYIYTLFLFECVKSMHANLGGFPSLAFAFKKFRSASVTSVSSTLLGFVRWSMGPKTAWEIVAEAATLPRFTAPVFRATKSAAVGVVANVWRGWVLDVLGRRVFWWWW